MFQIKQLTFLSIFFLNSFFLYFKTFKPLVLKFYKKMNLYKLEIKHKIFKINLCIRYFLWSLFVTGHICFIILVMTGGFYSPLIFFLHPLIYLQWLYFDFQCLGTFVERLIHPNNLSLCGRIHWWSVVLLWTNWVIVLLYNFYK